MFGTTLDQQYHGRSPFLHLSRCYSAIQIEERVVAIIESNSIDAQPVSRRLGRDTEHLAQSQRCILTRQALISYDINASILADRSFNIQPAVVQQSQLEYVCSIPPSLLIAIVGIDFNRRDHVHHPHPIHSYSTIVVHAFPCFKPFHTFQTLTANND